MSWMDYENTKDEEVINSFKKDIMKKAEPEFKMDRDSEMARVLQPLQGYSREIMEVILKCVDTDKLDENYTKYVNAVLDESTKVAYVQSTVNEIDYNSGDDDAEDADTEDEQEYFELTPISFPVGCRILCDINNQFGFNSDIQEWICQEWTNGGNCKVYNVLDDKYFWHNPELKVKFIEKLESKTKITYHGITDQYKFYSKVVP